MSIVCQLSTGYKGELTKFLDLGRKLNLTAIWERFGELFETGNLISLDCRAGSKIY